MDKVCFVVDAQGFFVENKFFPRELGVAGDDLPIYFTFDLPLKKLNDIDQKTVYFCEKMVHGIPWFSKPKKPDSLPVDVFDKILIHLYRKYRKNKTDMVGVRNGHLKEILEKLKIPIYDMEQETVTFDHITSCDLHQFEKRCCINKVLNLYKVIKESKI